MAITDQDVTQLAQLACIALSSDDTARLQPELNDILTLIQPLQAADTGNTSPLIYPLPGKHDATLRLRDDTAQPTATTQQRDALLANAPATANGLFLVPTVIE